MCLRTSILRFAALLFLGAALLPLDAQQKQESASEVLQHALHLAGPLNLALQALGGRARSWEPNVPVVPEHEPARANDGSLHSYWSVAAESLPADLGIEWAEPQTIASVIVRYFDGKMVRGPSVARTQQWARAQYWTGSGWKDLEARMLGQETSVVRYAFDPITTTRVRLLFTEPADPEFRRQPDRLGIYVCELEAYRDVPFRWITSDRLAHSWPGGDEDRKLTRYYNEPPSGDSAYDVANRFGDGVGASRAPS